jgi:multiple sugar transport system substrate-binding protein
MRILGVVWAALFGAGAAAAGPYDGVTVTVAVFASGPKGAISGPLYHWRDEWQRRTGATLEIREIPFEQLYEKIFGDLRSGVGAFDAFIGPSWFYGDYLEGDWIVPVDRMMRDPRFPSWNLQDVVPPIRDLLTWGGKTYGVANDCDAMILYYRKDLFRRPEYRKRFRAKYGYDLPDPPRTWEQMIDCAAFFDGWNFNAGTPLDEGKPGSGVAMHLKRGGQGFFHYLALSAPYVVPPGKRGDGRGAYWFDPETMEPLIASEGHVRALERLIALSKFGPRAQMAWSLGEAWDYFLKGRAALQFSWGDVGALAQDPSKSRVRGLLACATLPGTLEVWDRSAARWRALAEPNLVANTVGASWHGVISRYSKHPEAAYDLLAMQASRRVNFWNVTHGWTGINPGMRFHWLPPRGSASLEAYTAAGWDAADVAEYVKAYHENYHLTRSALEYLRIPGTPEYWDALDLHLAEAVTGSVPPKAALERVAADWRRITARRGRDRQLAAYREAIGYRK